MEHSERRQEIEQIGGIPVSYSDTVALCEVDDCPNPPLPVEELTLRWLDGSVTTIQMRRPPGWRDGQPEGQAEEFLVALRFLLYEMFNGGRGALFEAETHEGELCFFVSTPA
jgi:hypothetical protein